MMGENAHWWMAAALSGVISASIGVGAALIAMRIALARLEARFISLIEETSRRFDRLEKSVGIANGHDGGYFMTRRECALLDTTVGRRIDDLKTEVHEIKGVIDDVQRRVVHLESERGLE